MESRTYQAGQSDQSSFSLAHAHESSMSFKYKEFFDTHEPLTTSGEDLLDWLAKQHPHATYQDYLDLRKQTAEQGYKTAFDLPLTENEFKYRRLLKQFAQWNTDHQSTCVDADSLLDWLLAHHRGERLAYDEFLSLTQAGASQGLVTAIDVPVSEAEYNKKYLNDGLITLMPHPGQVAFTYDKGNLIIITPSEDGFPIIISSATQEVRFLNTNVQQLVFPSENEKGRRRQYDQNISADELNNFVFLTKDNLKIAMKLLVTFRINDPLKALSRLGENNIVNTIENLTSVDMCKMMMHFSSYEFMKGALPGFWDKIREGLAGELNSYGIELIRFNIETPFVLDKDIAKKMSEYATLNAEANAKQAIIVKQAQVQKAEAERDAMTKAEVKLTQAEAKAEAINTVGEAYKNNPLLLELEKTKIIGESMSKMPVMISLPLQPLKHVELPVLRPSIFSGFTLFQKNDKYKSIVNQDADCDKNNYSLKLSIR